MGIIHNAYCLHSDHLRARLFSIEDNSTVLTIDDFRKCAIRAFEACPQFGKDFLEAICFDKDWLELPSPDTHREEELFKVWIAQEIRGFHNLSVTSFAILERVLPALGWPEQRVRLLLVGRQLDQLAQRLGLSTVLSFDSSSNLVSWLSVSDARDLATYVRDIGDLTFHPSKEMLEAASIVGSSQESYGTLIERSFIEVNERLNLAIRQGFDLVLVNDVITHQLDKSRGLRPLALPQLGA